MVFRGAWFKLWEKALRYAMITAALLSLTGIAQAQDVATFPADSGIVATKNLI
jgi:hypothetical protein